MSKLKTASNYGSHVELTDVKFLCTAKLQEGMISLLPLRMDSAKKITMGGDGYLISFESSIELAVNILGEVLGSENPELIKPIMDRVKKNATKAIVTRLSAQK
jgi:hypothetical protein